MAELQIPEHKILAGSLGTSAQTAHKALLTKILISTREEISERHKTKPKWRAVSKKNCESFCNKLKIELSKLSSLDCDYRKLLTALNRAKTNSLGRVRPRPPEASNTTPEIDQLTKLLGDALNEHTHNPTLANLRKAKKLEKDLVQLGLSTKPKFSLNFSIK